MMMGKRKVAGDDDDTKWVGPGPRDEHARRVQRGFVDEIRTEAQKRGVEWKALLDRAELSSAARSRATHGAAGIKTLSKLRRALDDLAPAPSLFRASDEASRDEAPTINEAASLSGRRRWVVVQRQDRQMFIGVTADPDVQIADNGRVRLDRCRPVQATDVSPEALAAIGSTDPKVVGNEVPSALILNVAVVYDATRLAVRTLGFDYRK